MIKKFSPPIYFELKVLLKIAYYVELMKFFSKYFKKSIKAFPYLFFIILKIGKI